MNSHPGGGGGVTGIGGTKKTVISAQLRQKQQLYHPSIFRYTCTGRLSLDSRFGSNSKTSSGICHGIQSQLEHIDHWKLLSREDAIQQFEYKSSTGEIGYNNNMDMNSPSSPHSSNNSNSGTNSSGGTNSAEGLKEQAIYLSNVLVYPPPDDDDDDDDKNTTNNTGEKDMNRKQKNNLLISRKNTDGSTTVTPQEETWSCYGSTEVDLLVLRPEINNTNPNNQQQQQQQQKVESIAGVATYCSPGMTVRDIEIPKNSINGASGVGSAGGSERTTTIRMGILEIVYASVVENDTVDDNHTTGNRTNSKTKNCGDDDCNENNDTSTKLFGMSIPGITGTGSSSSISWIPDKVLSSGKTLIKHMKFNSQLIFESLQDNFPSRTYKAGHRITQEFSKTYDRTIDLMKKVLDDDNDEFDDDDNDE